MLSSITMIQADEPMCEERGRGGKWERIKCSPPVGCCKSGFYVYDHCGCLVRCFGQTETLSSRIWFFCQYYFFTRNVQALSAQVVEISNPIVLLVSSVSTRNRDAMTLTSTLGRSMSRTRTFAGVYLSLIELEFAKVKTMYRLIISNCFINSCACKENYDYHPSKKAPTCSDKKSRGKKPTRGRKKEKFPPKKKPTSQRSPASLEDYLNSL